MPFDWQDLRSVPLRPASTEGPPAVSWSFALFAGGYAGSLFWAAVNAATGRFPHPVWVFTVAASVGMVAVLFAVSDATVAGTTNQNGERTSPTYGLVGVPPLIFGGAYGLATLTLWGDTTTAVVVQATLLLLVFGTYARPYVPRELADLDGEELVDALDRHMRDWWGFTQLSVSVILAFGVGVAAGLLQSGTTVGSAEFVRLSVTTFFGAAALWAYALWKIRAVGSARRSAGAQPSAD